MSTTRSLFRYAKHLCMAAVLLGSLLAVQAPAQAYSPGDARALSLQKNAYTGKWTYTCGFSGWRSGAKVVYHCELFTFTAPGGYVKQGSVDGSWVPGPNSIAVNGSDVVPIGSGNICVRARAVSVDGGVNSGYQRCRFST